VPGRPGAPVPDAAQVVVVGGGVMGAGIAHALLLSGARVHISESASAAAEAAVVRVQALLARNGRAAPGSGTATSPTGSAPADCEDRLSAGIGLPSWGSVAAVFEAVPEVVALKREIAAASQRRYPEALIATNTSSLSIDQIADAMGDPGRLVGMHFFNPVPASRLIEIVVGARTAPLAVQQARSWVESVGKCAIEVRDSPGFATSRLGLAIGLEAIRMVEERVASVTDIDRGMTLGYKLPVGPLELTDRVGLDVRLAIADHLSATLGERFRAPELLRQMVTDGQLGRKSGAGFYRWAADGTKTGSEL